MTSPKNTPKDPSEEIEITSGHNRVCGMKNLHCFFMCIFILPLTLGIIAVTLVEAYMLRFYFKMVINSLSDQIRVQTSTVQYEMLMANKYFFLTMFTESFSEMYRFREEINDLKSQKANAADKTTLYALTLQSLKSNKTTCFVSENIDYKTFPACSDMFHTKDYKTSLEDYKVMIGNVFSVYNGVYNAKGEASKKMIEWQGEDAYSSDLAIMLSLAPMMSSLPDNEIRTKYREDRYNLTFNEVVTPAGIYGINYFNFEFINNQDISKVQCPADIQANYTNLETIKSDPRCFNWYTKTLDYHCAYQKRLAAKKNNTSVTLTPANTLMPFLVIPNPIQSTGGRMRVKVTMMTGYQKTDCDIASKKTYDSENYLISKDVYFYPLLDMIARAFSRSLANQLYYSTLSKDQIDSYIRLLDDIVSNKSTGDTKDYIGWVRKVERETKFAIGFYIAHLKEDFTYSVMADMKLDTFFDDQFKAPVNNPTDQDLQRVEDIKFIKSFIATNLTFKRDLETPASAIDLKSEIYHKYKLYHSSTKTFQEKRIFLMVESVGVTDKQTGQYIELFKVIYILPEYLITERYERLISDMDSKIFLNSIYASIVVLLFLVIGIVVILLFASKVVRHLNEAVLVAQKVSKGEPVIQSKEDVDKNLNYEIMQTKNALFDLNKVFNSSNASNSVGDSTDSSEDKNVLRYAYKIKLFSMLDDKRMCGVLNNNMGNIHFNAGRYNEAFSKYQDSIDILDHMYTNTGDSDKALSEEQYIMLKCDRIMNQCIAIKLQLELDIAKYGVNNTYDMIEKLKKLISYIKDRIPETAHAKYIKCFCLLAWVSRIREEPFNALNNLNQASERLSKFREKIPTDTLFLLNQEIDLERAFLLVKEKKYRKALAIVTDGLKRDKCFEMNFRKKYVALLVDIFKKMNVQPTPGVLELKERFLEKTVCRRYIIALDYSSSMRYGNKIANSIKAILDLWDNYIRPTDKVAFVRFNLNAEVVFGLESKGINSFAKKNEIERSVHPRDRTCFFDCVCKCTAMFKKDMVESANTVNYLIMLCDGDDTSSVKQEKEALSSIQEANCCLITVGLGLKNDPTTRAMLQRASGASSRRGGVYIDINDESFDDLFQVISEYANNLPYSELHWE